MVDDHSRNIKTLWNKDRKWLFKKEVSRVAREFQNGLAEEKEAKAKINSMATSWLLEEPRIPLGAIRGEIWPWITWMTLCNRQAITCAFSVGLSPGHLGRNFLRDVPVLLCPSQPSTVSIFVVSIFQGDPRARCHTFTTPLWPRILSFDDDVIHRHLGALEGCDCCWQTLQTPTDKRASRISTLDKPFLMAHG